MNNLPKIMGILNITPDSFFDGGVYKDLDRIEDRINVMIKEGVDIIDVGGFSSRPGSIMPTVEEELSRILPVLDYLNKLDIDFSVDTCRSQVVKEILKYKNLKYINDISGLKDEKILDLIDGKDIGYILMHIKGTPKNMQNNTNYSNIIKEIEDFFKEKIEIINKKDIKKVIIDVGFGFGKAIEDNYVLLKNLEKFKSFGFPILVGLSRKSMIYKLLGNTPENVLTETVSLNLYALNKGANIIRVHDIKEHKNIFKIYELLRG